MLVSFPVIVFKSQSALRVLLSFFVFFFFLMNAFFLFVV